MSLVLVTSGLLLTGCGAGSEDTAAQTDTSTSNTDTTTDNTTDNTPEAHFLTLTSQPASSSVYEGQSKTFSLSISNNYPITISWYKNGNKIAGASNSTYTVASASSGNAGTYSCSITDGELTVSCSNFTLTVNKVVTITTQPSNQMVNEGVDVELTVAATGTGPLSYQWYFNSQPISGATAATLALDAVTVSNDGNYYCVVSNAGSNATSTTATVDVAQNVVAAGKASISWSRPTTRADGSTLNSTDIAGYELYYSDTVNGTLEPLVSLTANEFSIEVDDLATGTHYFAMTTKDVNGMESSYSERFSVTIN